MSVDRELTAGVVVAPGSNERAIGICGWLKPVLDRSLTWDLLVGVKLLTFAIIIAIRPFNITHDCGLLLHAAQRMLDGNVPYVDFLEQNPPLIYYLFAIPVWGARTIGANPIPAYLGMFWLLIVASTLSVRRLLAMASDVLSPLTRGLMLLSFVVASECTLLAPDFGQREHGFAIAFVPLLVLRWLAYREDAADVPAVKASTIFRILIGLCAGVGVALKHHFVLMWIGIEFACVVRDRRWRKLIAPETLAAGSVLVVYLVHFAFLPTAMRDAFFGRWVPFILAHYWVYEQPISAAHVAFVGGVVVLYGGAAWVAWRSTRRTKGVAALTTMFALFTLFAIASFVVQRKDFSYHLIPIYFGALPCVALWVGTQAWQSAAATGMRLRWCVAGIVLGTIPSAAIEVALSWTIGRQRDAPTAIWREILDRSQAGDSLLFISTNVGDGYPELVKYGYTCGSRYLVSMPMALVHSDLRLDGGERLYHDISNRPSVELQYLGELAADIDKNQPRLIAIVDQTDCQGCAPGFNVHECLRRAGLLSGVMASYRDVGAFQGKVSTLRLYERRGGGDSDRAAR